MDGTTAFLAGLLALTPLPHLFGPDGADGPAIRRIYEREKNTGAAQYCASREVRDVACRVYVYTHGDDFVRWLYDHRDDPPAPAATSL